MRSPERWLGSGAIVAAYQLDEGKSMAPNGTRFQIGIYFVDTTYGKDGSTEDWEAQSAALKHGIEREYGIQLRDEDIAPGFSFPAFETITAEYWIGAAPVAMFFAGEKIEKSIDAWLRLYKRIKQFLNRPAYLDRNGASVLAMHAVIEECKSGARSLKLEGYAIWSSLEGKVEYDTKQVVGFADPPETKYLGVIVHIFQIAADNRRFKVYVEGNSANLTEMPSSLPKAADGQ
jgi:hypothetical protein